MKHPLPTNHFPPQISFPWDFFCIFPSSFFFKEIYTQKKEGKKPSFIQCQPFNLTLLLPQSPIKRHCSAFEKTKRWFSELR
ncbi:hypothetical protein V6N13_102365 [Hibiscus sabdariffa]|uniref:Uncharacterized protein n=1 Tax=Hibiscus sabdariffa TaxID=183260 RepID=A0ABR2D4L0_9ROSI